MSDHWSQWGYVVPSGSEKTPEPSVLDDPPSPLLEEARASLGGWSIHDNATGTSSSLDAPQQVWHKPRFERTAWNGGVVPTPRPRRGRPRFAEWIHKLFRRHKDGDEQGKG
jgi:hypothetical protein